MRSILPILLGLLALLVLAVVCARHHRPAIEKDLAARAAAKWGGLAGIESVSLSASGRELILSGSVASDELRRQLISDAQVRGVRRVEDRLTISAGAPATSSLALETDAASETDGNAAGDASPELRVARRSARDWDLSGTLSSSDRKAIEDSVASSVSASAVDSPVTMEWQPFEETSSQLVDTALVALTWVHQLERAELQITPEGLKLRGRAMSPELALRLRSALRQQLPSGLSADIDLDADWRAEDLQIHVADSDGRISLDGLIPRGDLRQRLNQAASQVRGPEAVDDALLETDLAAPAGFGRGVEAVLPELDQLRNARVSESTESGLTVQGLAEAATAEGLRASIAANLPANHDFELSVAAELARTECQEAINSLLAADNILFDSGSARISATSDTLVQQLAATLLRCPGYRLRIAGHTDSDGDADFNRQLSSRRANAVEQRLMILGVAGQRISSTGHGEDQPVASNDTPEGKAQNRRIEFQLEETR